MMHSLKSACDEAPRCVKKSKYQSRTANDQETFRASEKRLNSEDISTASQIRAIEELVTRENIHTLVVSLYDDKYTLSIRNNSISPTNSSQCSNNMLTEMATYTYENTSLLDYIERGEVPYWLTASLPEKQLSHLMYQGCIIVELLIFQSSDKPCDKRYVMLRSTNESTLAYVSSIAERHALDDEQALKLECQVINTTHKVDLDPDPFKPRANQVVSQKLPFKQLAKSLRQAKCPESRRVDSRKMPLYEYIKKHHRRRVIKKSPEAWSDFKTKLECYFKRCDNAPPDLNELLWEKKAAPLPRAVDDDCITVTEQNYANNLIQYAVITFKPKNCADLRDNVISLSIWQREENSEYVGELSIGKNMINGVSATTPATKCGFLLGKSKSYVESYIDQITECFNDYEKTDSRLMQWITDNRLQHEQTDANTHAKITHMDSLQSTRKTDVAQVALKRVANHQAPIVNIKLDSLDARIAAPVSHSTATFANASTATFSGTQQYTLQQQRQIRHALQLRQAQLQQQQQQQQQQQVVASTSVDQATFDNVQRRLSKANEVFQQQHHQRSVVGVVDNGAQGIQFSNLASALQQPVRTSKTVALDELQGNAFKDLKFIQLTRISNTKTDESSASVATNSSDQVYFMNPTALFNNTEPKRINQTQITNANTASTSSRGDYFLNVALPNKNATTNAATLTAARLAINNDTNSSHIMTGVKKIGQISQGAATNSRRLQINAMPNSVQNNANHATAITFVKDANSDSFTQQSGTAAALGNYNLQFAKATTTPGTQKILWMPSKGTYNHAQLPQMNNILLQPLTQEQKGPAQQTQQQQQINLTNRNRATLQTGNSFRVQPVNTSSITTLDATTLTARNAAFMINPNNKTYIHGNTVTSSNSAPTIIALGIPQASSSSGVQRTATIFQYQQPGTANLMSRQVLPNNVQQQWQPQRSAQATAATTAAVIRKQQNAMDVKDLNK